MTIKTSAFTETATTAYVYINIYANIFATSKFAIEWHSYNTSEPRIDAVKLANIDSINSVTTLRIKYENFQSNGA